MRVAPSPDDHLRHLDVIVQNRNANPNLKGSVTRSNKSQGHVAGTCRWVKFHRVS